MDMGLIRGLLTLAVCVLFIAISFWAYSKNRRTTFDALAAMPLADEQRVSELTSATHASNEEDAR